LDIPKQVRILDIQKGYFGYQKQQFRISEKKTFISDIKNSYYGYPK